MFGNVGDIRTSLEVGFPASGLPEKFAGYRGRQTRSIAATDDFPYENGQFSVVLLDRAAVTRQAVREAHRVLLPRGKLIFEVPERTRGQEGFSLPDIYSLVREGFNIVRLVRPAWWKFWLKEPKLTICAEKKNWRLHTNTYRPYV